MELLNAIPSLPTNDKDFVNKAFGIVYGNSYLYKLIQKGLGREQCLIELRKTKRYATIKGLVFFIHILL